MTITTINPTIDGYLLRQVASDDWATIVTGSGTSAVTTGTDFYAVGFNADNVNDKWTRLYRGALIFDTSGIPAGDIISAVTIKLGGFSKSDSLGAAPNINVYGLGASGTDAQLLTGDYELVESTPFCDTPITYAGWDTDAGLNNQFELNADGIAAINTGGYTRFSLRNPSYDVAISPPTWGFNQTTSVRADASEAASDDPVLEIVHASNSLVGRMILI
jgi:hypothetical protein